MKSIVTTIKGSVLRNRFLLYFVVFSTVPVLILGSVSLSLIDLSHRRDVSALELQLIDQKIEEIEKFDKNRKTFYRIKNVKLLKRTFRKEFSKLLDDKKEHSEDIFLAL